MTSPGRSLVGSPSGLDKLLRPVLRRQVAGKEAMTAGPDRYDRYGFRVPAVIVSPYARPDYVCSRVLDHTSVLKLVEEKWNLPAADRPRRGRPDAAGRARPVRRPAFLDPPVLPAPSLPWGTW